MQLLMFSKMLKNIGGLSVEEAGDYIANLGFDGVDLTVRPGGHILPREARSKLPEAIEILNSKGLSVPMITTNITSANEKYAEEIMKACKLGKTMISEIKNKLFTKSLDNSTPKPKLWELFVLIVKEVSRKKYKSEIHKINRLNRISKVMYDVAMIEEI